MAMMAITTSNSISVNPDDRECAATGLRSPGGCFIEWVLIDPVIPPHLLSMLSLWTDPEAKNGSRRNGCGQDVKRKLAQRGKSLNALIIHFGADLTELFQVAFA